MSTRRSARLTIFEGPDGGGKTTAAIEYAKETGAHYVHLGSFPSLREGLARMYVEAMMPAILGHADVVMDRCWMSEPIYGSIYRGAPRLTGVEVRMLERLAMRCATVVVRCMTTKDEMLNHWRGRLASELVKDETKMRAIIDAYVNMPTSLPLVEWNYLMHPSEHLQVLEDDELRTIAHKTSWWSAGNIDPGAWLLVGEAFANHAPHDPLYQWPFGSFGGKASRWLTLQLIAAGISEDQLAWVNADDPSFEEVSDMFSSRRIVALGAKAVTRLGAAGVVNHKAVEHPSYWARFKADEPYPLARLMSEETVA